MSIRKLVEFFSPCEPPIKIQLVLEQIRDMGITDRVYFKGFDEDPAYLLGMLVQWNTPHLYGDETRDAAVCYNQNVPIEMQRLICCKEMIHLFDLPELRVTDRTDLERLMHSVFGGLPGARITHTIDLAAMLDTAAIYHALAVLFPAEARDEFAALYASDPTKLEEIVRKVGLPTEYVQLALSDEWVAGRDLLLGG